MVRLWLRDGVSTLQQRLRSTRKTQRARRTAAFGRASSRIPRTTVTTINPTPPAQRRSDGAAPPSSCDGLLIKGNINAQAERIYHVPGSSSYDENAIDESKGERWFRTESEARAAGWRAPRG
jgi:hypothetical protein